jgi:hypothetical protein
VQWRKPVILAIQKAEFRMVVVQGQTRQQVHETPSQPVIPATQGSTKRKITVQAAGLGIKQNPISNQCKKG